VGASAIGAARWRGRTTARSSLKAATSRASGVVALVHCSGVVEGADGANRRGGGAPGGDVAESPAVLTLRVPIGRVGASRVRKLEKSRIEEAIVGTSPGWTETMTEVADLPSLDCALGLRYLVERMRIFFELRMDSARHGKSSSGSSGRKAIGRE